MDTRLQYWGWPDGTRQTVPQTVHHTAPSDAASFGSVSSTSVSFPLNSLLTKDARIATYMLCVETAEELCYLMLQDSLRTSPTYINAFLWPRSACPSTNI